MFEQPVLDARSDTSLAPGAGSLVGLDRHAPAQNQLLAALPPADYERLLLDLEPVALPAGRTVHESGDEERYLYFLTAGIVCRFYGPENGPCAGLGITGNEGVIGVASFLGGESSPSQAEVLCAGYAYRLRADLLRGQFEHNGPLPQLLLRYTRALFTQVGHVRGVQPTPFAGAAIVPLALVMPGPLALEPDCADTRASRPRPGRAARRGYRSSGKAARGRTDPFDSRASDHPRSPRPGSAGMRVL